MTRRAVVTGARGAIGEAVVRDLAARFEVIALGRNLNSQAGAHRVRWHEFPGSDADAARRLSDELGDVDVLVHTAGIATRRGAAEASAVEWSDAFEVNVTAAAVLTSALLPGLRRKAGTIVFLNSGVGRATPPDHAVYAASKYALRSLADSFRVDERASGIAVTSIYPGPVDSRLLRADASERGVEYESDLTLSVESVVRAVRFAIDQTPDAQVEELVLRPRRSARA